MHRRSGFTLVELAIVLVIIGLIVGGVLVGTDLIKSAGLRAQIKQIDDIKASILAFKLKYNCLPGDCKNANSFLTAATQPDSVSNGDGDDLIGAGWLNGNPSGVYDWSAGKVDYKKVFDHLAAAGMYSIATYDETSRTSNFSGIAFPRCAFQPEGTMSTSGPDQCGVIISYEANAHYFRIGATGVSGGWNLYFYGGYTPTTALQFDTKFDDGNALTGGIKAGPTGYQTDGSGNDLVTDAMYGVVGTAAWQYTQKCSWTDGTYYTQGTVRTCSLRVKAGF